MRKTFSGFWKQRQNWAEMVQAAGQSNSAGFNNTPSGHLTEIKNFGSNPGNLRMFTHPPSHVSADSALVVVLHGCTQSAAVYDLGAGWSTLADRFGFTLLLPEQQRSNNPNGCFNWFQAGDIERGRGEAHSIKQMIEKMVLDHGIDPGRVFVTGLSAGGAMASVMLATYPDVFAGGAIVAGLPYGAATNVQQAFETMYQCPPRPAPEWGDLVRGASPHQGPWPRISVWHGGMDATVIPSNAREIVKQWIDVHGLPMTPTAQEKIDDYPRQVWASAAGDELIESYTITNMAHGTPLATGAADHECGAAGPFLLEVGISSSYHIAKFFGLTVAGRRQVVPTHSEIAATSKAPQASRRPPVIPQSNILDGEILPPDVRTNTEGISNPPSLIDIGAVINKALKDAGLMK